MKKFSILLLALLVICFTSNGLAQQTGSLKGTVADDEGNPLPGVTVIISSPNMQGTQSYISTGAGDFRFPSLPPGEYTIRTELAGFQTVERPGIRVRVGSTTTITVQMTPSTLDEEVTVIAPSPVIDVESTDIAVTMTKDLITSIPIQRDILDLYKAAPATVARDTSNDYQKSASVAGDAVENSKISIDGVDLIDPSRGYISAEVIFDAIEEVEMTIGGHKAEVGQASAGVLSVVTKSGGNTFSGSIVVGGTTDKLTQVLVPQEQIDGFGLAAPMLKEYKYDVGASFGGPIIKDKVWFFVSPRYRTFKQSTWFVPFTDPDGVYHPEYPNIRKDYIGLGKVTVQIAKNLKWFGMYQYNLGDESPEMWSVTDKYKPLESQIDYFDDSHTASSVLTYIMNQNSFLEARFGMVRRHMWLPYSGQWEGPSDRPYHYDKATLYEWGEPSNTEEHYYRNNWNVGLIFTRFQDDLLGGDHEFKGGLEYSRSSIISMSRRNIPYFFYWYNGTPWYFGDVEAYKGEFEISTEPDVLGHTEHTSGMWRWSFFIQDTMNIGERLVVNFGVRYDDSHGYVPAQTYKGFDDKWYNGLANKLLPQIFQPAGSTLTSPAMDDIMVYKFLSPRFGLTYDLFGSGKTLLKASFARYGDQLLTTALGSLIPLPEKYVTFTWWDDNHNGQLDLPPIDRYQDQGYMPYSIETEPLKRLISSDLEVPSSNELTLSLSHQLSDDSSIVFSYIRKSAKHGMGSINLNIAKDSKWWIPYTVTDPGDDGKLNTGDEQNLTVYMLRSDAPGNFIQKANIDEAWRKYWGFTMLFNKRMSHGWMFSGSATYNKAWGNYAHGYLSYAGWQNFWNPNNDINRTGRLQYDRPIVIKAMSTVQLPYDFNLSAYFRYYSGAHFERQVTVYFPSTVQGYSARYSSAQVNAEPEGNRDHASESMMDMRLEKTFQLGQFNVGVWAEVFNLFGHWYFTWSQNRLAGGYIYPDGSFKKYPRYGQPNAVFGAREFAFGARFRF